MNLDDFTHFSKVDLQDMLAEVDSLPDLLEKGWDQGQSLPLPDWQGIQRVVIAGMGGSAIGADLIAAFTAARCLAPLVVQRNYTLPGWARGPETLVIASSHSGNTEETLEAFDQAVANGCRVLSICTGGKLAEKTHQAGAELWRFEHKGQPRAAVGYSFGLLLAAFTRLGLIPDPAQEVMGTLAALRAQQANLRADVPLAHNPAKRMAGQLVGRMVVVFGADVLEPVARRWKGQISEVAKAWAQCESLPEADHNTVAGVTQPEELLAKNMALFLRAPSYHPRNRLRTDLTQRLLMLEGMSTDFVDAKGEAPLAHQWTALHFGDYVSFYLAMIYEIDPTPVPTIASLKREMSAAGG